MPQGDVVVVTPWREFVVVCAKCSRKLDGGFGPDGEQGLRGALNDELRERGRRREVRVVDGGCFGLCPKGGVAVAHGAVPGRLLAAAAGEAAGRVLERLGVGKEARPDSPPACHSDGPEGAAEALAGSAETRKGSGDPLIPTSK